MTSFSIPNRQRILVADDEKVIADTLKLILSQHGFDITVAYDQVSKLRSLQKNLYPFLYPRYLKIGHNLRDTDSKEPKGGKR